MPYRTALCGLGNIAWCFGHAFPGKGLCLSHAEAYDRQSATTLVAGFAPEKKEQDRFTQALRLPAYATLESLLVQEKPDIVSICSPSAFHYEQVMTCLEHQVPMVWLEKPPALSLKEMDSLIQRAGETDSTLLVNYQRRYLPVYQALKSHFDETTMGTCHRIEATYSRGLEINGSHILDMVFSLTGDGAPGPLQWVSGNLENPSFGFSIQGLEICILGADLPYHDIDIRLTCEAGRISVLHGGMTALVENREEHEFFPGFFRLKTQEDTAFTKLPSIAGGMETALEDLMASHEKKCPPLSNLISARNTMALVEAVRSWQKKEKLS